MGAGRSLDKAPCARVGSTLPQLSHCRSRPETRGLGNTPPLPAPPTSPPSPVGEPPPS